MTRICTCRSAEWHVEPCPDDLFLGGLLSGAVAANPVVAAAPVTAPAGPHASAAVGSAGHHRTTGERSALTLRRRPFLTWLLDRIGRPA